MEATANNSTALYVGWEEVVVSNEKGRREVHYFLKRGGGGRDLLVVGKEKSVRHMYYRYKIKSNNALFANLNRSCMWKLRSRRDVISWINSILSVSDGQPNDSFRQLGGVIESNLNDDVIKEVQTRTYSQYKFQFRWLGSPWTCKKRRRHYQSFCRNGVMISAQDFVYVLAEEGKRLVAYLDDMYEDIRGNKMAVVRWFHKIDEVFVLPGSYNDREIFFSLCLQDLSIECLDGLATVLCPEHYEKYKDQATHMGLELFVCYRQFNNDVVKPFDVTSIKGYWKQGLLRNISSSFGGSAGDIKMKGSVGDASTSRSYKRTRWSKECDFPKLPNESTDPSTPQIHNGSSCNSKSCVKVGSLKEGCPYVSSSGQDVAVIQTCDKHLTIGSFVEVLCQDSGLKGCWFRALIIKKHKDKVKVQYKDVKDAADDSKNLEEWILASRVAAPDRLGIRLSGRIMVRPTRSCDEGGVPGGFVVGSIIDAWWHDGWWEGIVLRNESEDRLLVYFPGEMQKQIFSSSDLRYSKEWVNNCWLDIKGRPELVPKFSGVNELADVYRDSAPSGNRDLAAPIQSDALARNQDVVKIVDSVASMEDEKMQNRNDRVVGHFSKDCVLRELRWGASKKRRVLSSVHKLQFGAHANHGNQGMQSLDRLFVNSKFDPDNCKYANDSQFSASRLTSLVMSS